MASYVTDLFGERLVNISTNTRTDMDWKRLGSAVLLTLVLVIVLVVTCTITNWLLSKNFTLTMVILGVICLVCVIAYFYDKLKKYE